jgi:hypothetical protein
MDKQLADYVSSRSHLSHVLTPPKQQEPVTDKYGGVWDPKRGSMTYPENPNLGPQFKGGPEEARLKAGEDEDDEYVEAPHPGGYGQERTRSLYAPPQGQLFDPDKVPELEAHHQTPSQFAQSPQTWWHGRYTKSGKISEEGEQSGEGFHSGTKESAEERLAARYPSEVWPGHAGHLYPLRITGAVIGPHNLHVDQGYHDALGYHDRATGYLYENSSEDAGSISVGTPHRQGWMSTHREMVDQAKQEGKPVHPLIDWASQHHPEHEGEEWKHPRFGQAAEDFRIAAGYQQPASSKQGSLLDPDEEGVSHTSSRRTFQTESGHQVHVTKMHQHPILGGQWAETRVMENPDYHTWGEPMLHSYQPPKKKQIPHLGVNPPSEYEAF